MSEVPSQPAPLPRFIPWLVLAVALCFCIDRVRSGVDLEDEATYVAIPYRFVLGDRPFIDEINPIQTAGFITEPLIWAFVSATGGTEGIVLFLRFVYLAVCIGAAFVAWLCVRRHLDGGLAALCVAPIVVQMPGIANLGYHTISSLGFTIGVFAVAHGLRTERGKYWIFVGGVMHGLATIAIQVYLASSFLFFLAAFLWWVPGRRLRLWVPYLVGALLTFAVFAPRFFDLGSETLDYTYRHTTRDGTWNFKTIWVFANHVRAIPNKYAIGATVLVLIVAARLRWSVITIPATLALTILASRWHPAIGANIYITMIATLAPFLYLALHERSAVRPLFLALWLPSFLAGLGLAWASSVHVMSEGYSQLPAFIVTSILAVTILREAWPRAAVWTSAVWVTTVIAVFLIHQRYPYNEDPLAQLDTRIADGPWRGIATTKAKADYVAAIQADVERFADPTKRVLFFSHFPAGYLMSPMRPAASSVWAITCPQNFGWDQCTEALERDLSRHEAAGIVVFDMRAVFHSSDFVQPLSRGPAHKFLEDHLQVIHETLEYKVYLSP